MALPSTRLEYRITLCDVEKSCDLKESVILARHPSETARHVTLRVLAWCIFHEERLGFGPGLSIPDSADLWAHDLTGQLMTWIECGSTTTDQLQHIVRHHSQAQVRVLLDDPERSEGLATELRALGMKRGMERITLYSVDAALVAELAADEHPRQTWSVTIVGDHLYVEAGARSLNGPYSTIRFQGNKFS